MNLTEAILALLETKFPGVRKDGLNHLAAAISLQVGTKEEAEALVGKFTAEKVGEFVTGWRKSADAEIGKANQTYENSLKEKYDFVEKGKTPPPSTPPTTPPPGGAITLEAIEQLMDKKLAGIQNSITADRTATARRELFVKELDEAKVTGRTRDMMMRNFDSVNTFKTDDDFNAYLTTAKGDIAALQQERADAGLLNHERPVFGAVNKDGVSEGVAAYISATTGENKNALTGKEV